MSQDSIFWTTNGVGDGASPYTMTDLTLWVRHMLGNGVHPNFGDELEVTGTASPLSIGYGAAIVNGFPFYADPDDDPYSVAIVTPTNGTTGHSIVVRADWTAQTVRFAVRSSADGNGAFPDVVVDEGVVSEILLAHASITIGGVVTVTDARDWLYYRTRVDSTMIDDGAIATTAILADNVVTAAKIANRTRTLFVAPISDDYTPFGLPLANGVTSTGQGTFLCPNDYASTMTVQPVLMSPSNGDARVFSEYWHGGIGEDYDIHAAGSSAATVAMIGDVRAVFTTTALSSMAIGDIVICTCVREGADVLDTLADDLYLVGFIVSYIADS